MTYVHKLELEQGAKHLFMEVNEEYDCLQWR